MAHDTKTCRTCGAVKPLDEYRQGRNACLACARATYRATYAATREQRVAYARAYHATHREQSAALNRKWMADNAVERREYEREYKQRTSTRAAELLRIRRAANPAAEPERQRIRRAANPIATAEQARYAAALRRSRLAKVLTIPFTLDQLNARLAYYGHRCWMCRGPYEHLDHVKPICVGGPHILANLRPACARCNLKKGGKWSSLAAREAA